MTKKFLHSLDSDFFGFYLLYCIMIDYIEFNYDDSFKTKKQTNKYLKIFVTSTSKILIFSFIIKMPNYHICLSYLQFDE